MLNRNLDACETIFKSENDILRHLNHCFDLFEYHLAWSEGNYHIEISRKKFKKQIIVNSFSIFTYQPILKRGLN